MDQAFDHFPLLAERRYRCARRYRAGQPTRPLRDVTALVPPEDRRCALGPANQRGIYNQDLPAARTTKIEITRRMDVHHRFIFPVTQEPISSDARPASAPILDAAFAGVRRVPEPVNDPNRSYAPGTPERAELKARLKTMAAERIEIPLIIGGKEIRTGRTEQAVMPHDHSHVLADYHLADPEHVQQAIAASACARREWASWPWEDRAAVILRAAELLATSWRSTIVAATMLGQSKTAFQAEIDAASEMIDFWRFNAYFAQELYHEQPVSSPGMWNQMEYRALEGFVYAISPFNFTAIGGNLTTAPALMGNTVVWKPAASAMLSGYYTLRLLEEAGLPPGVINLVPGDSVQITGILLDSPELAGVHFTGSTAVFNSMWKTVGENVGKYRGYPRLVGETGGKDFIVAHPRPIPRRWRWRSRAAASSIRDRSARPRAASMSRSRSGTRSAIARSG